MTFTEAVNFLSEHPDKSVRNAMDQVVTEFTAKLGQMEANIDSANKSSRVAQEIMETTKLDIMCKLFDIKATANEIQQMRGY